MKMILSAAANLNQFLNVLKATNYAHKVAIIWNWVHFKIFRGFDCLVLVGVFFVE